MAYTTINKPTDYFETVTYSGNGTGQDITTLDFQPDWLWIKRRDSVGSHRIQDSIRGTTNYLQSDKTDTEASGGDVDAFLSNGFSLSGGSTAYNVSGGTYVGWSWLGGGTASSNTDGSITSSVSANTTAGFSIVSWVGNATGSATIGHGLGVKPKVFFCKNRTDADSWVNWQDTTNDGTADVRMNLNQTAADRNDNFITFGTSTITLPSTSDNGWNGSSDNMIAYCFAEKKGYSKFGSYTGTGVDAGPFSYCGFKPSFVLIKRTDSSGSWVIQDNKRPGYNETSLDLNPNNSEAEETNNGIDMLSNGFKQRNTDAHTNASGGTYIYMAFAESPFVTSGTKAAGTAR